MIPFGKPYAVLYTFFVPNQNRHRKVACDMEIFSVSAHLRGKECCNNNVWKSPGGHGHVPNVKMKTCE